MPPNLIDRATGVGLFQNGLNLRIGEIRLARANLLARVAYCARKFSLMSVVVYGELTMHEPPLPLQDAIDRFAVHEDPALASQQDLQAAVPERGMLPNELLQPLDPRRISRQASRRPWFRPMQPGSAHPQYLTTPPFRDTRHARSHASDVFRSKG